ncbi:hypothetical protein K438DRAFT_2014309 [Mycena galopus ATCC 62051]|nr:hypothetical protein K438DRAFT_2014309 [Mycena galopus ATCC 62051]
MAPLSPAESQLLTQLLESIFWGIYVVTLGFCLQALLRIQNRWKKPIEISKPMLAVAVIMGCIATFDMCLTFAININAFVFYDGPGGPKAAFDNTSGWMDVMGTVDVIVQTVLGDIMLIYRCWIVYGRSWTAIAVPVVLAVAGLACIGVTVFLEVTLPAASQFASPYKEVVVSTWALTICINVITTSLILFRIWRVDRQNAGLISQSTVSPSRKGPYYNAKRIIIESGLMYTTVATVTASVYISGSNAFAPLTGIDVQMIGIAFNLILIRVHRNRAAELNPNSIARDRQSASSLRFGVTPDISEPTDTALGDLESNYRLERLEDSEQDSEASTSLSLREKAAA